LLHLDIKPANIFISSRDYLVIGDFGQATNLDESSKEAGDSRYMAPETLNFPPTRESDLFSMGATIFEAASLLEMPKGGAYWRALRGTEPNIDQASLICNSLSCFSDDLKNVIFSMMKHNPSERITTGKIFQLPQIRHVLSERFQRFNDPQYKKDVEYTISLNEINNPGFGFGMGIGGASNGPGGLHPNDLFGFSSSSRSNSQSNSMLFTPQPSHGSHSSSSLMSDEDFFVSPPEPLSADRSSSSGSGFLGNKLKRNLAQDFEDDNDNSSDFL